MTKKTTRVLLSEQHRNTRHDAIDEINAARNRFVELHMVPDNVWDAMTSQIMNLKQRVPEGAPTKDDICTGCKRYGFDNVQNYITDKWEYRENCRKGHFHWMNADNREPVESCKDFKECESTGPKIAESK